jgi:hypothetical protein
MPPPSRYPLCGPPVWLVVATLAAIAVGACMVAFA